MSCQSGPSPSFSIQWERYGRSSKWPEISKMERMSRMCFSEPPERWASILERMMSSGLAVWAWKSMENSSGRRRENSADHVGNSADFKALENQGEKLVLGHSRTSSVAPVGFRFRTLPPSPAGDAFSGVGRRNHGERRPSAAAWRVTSAGRCLVAATRHVRQADIPNRPPRIPGRPVRVGGKRVLQLNNDTPHGCQGAACPHRFRVEPGHRAP